MTAFCTGDVSCLSLQIFAFRYAYPITSNKYFLPEMQYVKKDRTMLVLIITVLVLILLVYFIFEKRIEAIPYKIN